MTYLFLCNNSVARKGEVMRKVTKIDDNNLNTTGKRIAYLRTNKGISQQELADLLKVKRQKISYIESDKPNRQLNIEELEQLATFFNVSTDYLLCRVNAQSNEYTEISKQLGLSDKSIEILKNNTIINKFIEETERTRIWKFLDSFSAIKYYLHLIVSEYFSFELRTGDLNCFIEYLNICDKISNALLNIPLKYYCNSLRTVINRAMTINEFVKSFKRYIPTQNNDMLDFDLGKVLLFIQNNQNIKECLEVHTEEEILKSPYVIAKEHLFDYPFSIIRCTLEDEAELLEYKISKEVSYILAKVAISGKTQLSTDEKIIKKVDNIIKDCEQIEDTCRETLLTVKNNDKRKEVNGNGDTGN